MASGYPADFSPEKTPEYTPYPSAPGYQQFAPQSSPPTISSHVHNKEDTEPRRPSTDSYDDVFQLSKPVEVTFKEVFQESKGSESPEVIFNINTTVFTYTMRGIYIFLSVVLGVILSIVWGIAFGVLNFVVTWLCQPALKMLFILLRIAANAFGPVLRVFLDPFFQSWGYVFSKIRGAFNFNVNGLSWLKKEKRRALPEEV